MWVPCTNMKRPTSCSQAVYDIKIADSTGKYTTTWKIIHKLSWQRQDKTCVEVNKTNGTPPTSETDLLAERREYFSSLLNNTNSQSPSVLSPPTAQDLRFLTNPATREKMLSAIRKLKTIKAVGLDRAITTEAFQNGSDSVVDTVHGFSAEVYTSLTPPIQWTTSFIIPLPEKGDLSQISNYRGISLLSISAKVYNKILFTRIRDHVDPI